MRKIFLACAALLVTSAAYALDCGDKDVIDGVIEVARRNDVFLKEAIADLVNKKMTELVEKARRKEAEMKRDQPRGPLPVYRQKPAPGGWCADTTNASRLSSGESWRLYHMPCFDHNPSQDEIQQAFDSTGTGEGHTLNNPKDVLLLQMMLGGPLGVFASLPKEAQEQLKERIRHEMQYSVETIRTKYHDTSTEELSCAAQFKGDTNGIAGTYELPIRYTVEITTDKRLYIQITKDNLEDGQMH